MEKTLGATYNFPEKNCCACGKGTISISGCSPTVDKVCAMNLTLRDTNSGKVVKFTEERGYQ